MTEWISVKNKKPGNLSKCLVCNYKGWMFDAVAVYYSRDDIFIEQNSMRSGGLALDVTHYIEIPPCPNSEYRNLDE